MKVKIDNLVNYSIISFGLYPIMPNNLKGIFMILLFLSSLNYFLRYKKDKFDIKQFIINSSLFFIYLISLTFTRDLNYGFKNLGPGISIILFPLVFFILLSHFKIKREIIQRMLNLFTFSTVSFMIIFILHFTIKVYPTLYSEISFFDVNYIRSYLRVLPWIGQHPIYLGLFIGVSLINLIYRNIKRDIYFIVPSLLFLFLLLSSLFYISSKGAILYLVISVIIVYFIKMKNKKESFFISIVILGVTIIFIFFTPHINKRFMELVRIKTYTSENIDINNSSQIRLAIWKTSIESIKKSPITGYGIGDVQNVLNNSYKNKYPILLKTQYNSHNQYFGIWLSTGIIGILIFIYFLYFNFKIGFKNKDFTFLAILLFFCLNFLTENIIERQTGATLFFFFINLFGFYNHSDSLESKKENI